MILWGE